MIKKIKEIWNADTRGVVGSMTPIDNAEEYDDHMPILRAGMPEVNRRVQEGIETWARVFTFIF